MRLGSVTSSMTRSWPPQSGHRVMSMLKTRLSRCAQERGEGRGERWVVLSIRLGNGSGCFCRFADDRALFWSFVLVLGLRALCAAGTMCCLSGDEGANTP